MKSIKDIVKYLLSLGAAGLLMWYLYRGQNFEDFSIELARTNYFWVALCFVAAFISHLARAYRWNLLLNPIGYKPSLFNTFYAVMVGYMANLVFPRAGEVSRCAMLYKTDKVPLETGIGTVLSERLIDLICLLIIVGATIMVEFEVLGGFIQKLFAQKSTQESNHTLIYYFIGGFLFSFLIMLIFKNKIIQSPIFQKIKKIWSGLLEGILSVRSVNNKTGFFISTVVIWVMYFLTVYFLFFAFKTTEHLGAHVALALFVVGSLGMVAPVPGGVGAFHYMVTNGLVLYGIQESVGKTFAGLAHAIQMAQIVVIGLIVYFASFHYLKTYPEKQ